VATEAGVVMDARVKTAVVMETAAEKVIVDAPTRCP